MTKRVSRYVVIMLRMLSIMLAIFMGSFFGSFARTGNHASAYIAAGLLVAFFALSAVRLMIIRSSHASPHDSAPDIIKKLGVKSQADPYA